MTHSKTPDRDPADVIVTNNAGESRYELVAAQGTALAVYQLRGDVVAFIHTEVPDALEGQGVGSVLVAGALADVRRQGRAVLPLCSFVKHYIETHEEEQDLLAK